MISQIRSIESVHNIGVRRAGLTSMKAFHSGHKKVSVVLTPSQHREKLYWAFYWDKETFHYMKVFLLKRCVKSLQQNEQICLKKQTLLNYLPTNVSQNTESRNSGESKNPLGLVVWISPDQIVKLPFHYKGKWKQSCTYQKSNQSFTLRVIVLEVADTLVLGSHSSSTRL